MGEESSGTIREASNLVSLLNDLQRYEEAKALMHKTIPVTRRVLGENQEMTLRMRMHYGRALYGDDAATLDDLREAVETLEETKQITQRVLGNAHPVTRLVGEFLEKARVALGARSASL